MAERASGRRDKGRQARTPPAATRPVSIKELVEGLHDEQRTPEAPHTLLELARLAPEFIAAHVETIRTMISGPDERLTACGLAMLSRIARLSPNAVWPCKNGILKAFEEGSTEVREAALVTLVVLASSTPTRRNHLSPMLVEALHVCQARDLPCWARLIVPVLTGRGRAKAAGALSPRMAGLDPRARRQLSQVLKRHCWSSGLATFPGSSLLPATRSAKGSVVQSS